MKFARFCFAMIFVVCLSSTAHPSTDAEISELDQRTTIEDVLGIFEKRYVFADVPGPRLPDIPVYVLTSGRTASAGEAFTYNLQSYKRATIVGGVTRAIAHWIDVVDLPDHELRVNVPYARPVSAVTGGNWEGTGVVPDIDYVLLPLTEDLFAFDDTDDLRFRIIRAQDGAVSGYQLVYQNGETGGIKPKTGELP